MIYSIILAVLAISPVYYDYGVGMSGMPYLCVALILSLCLLVSALRFIQSENKTAEPLNHRLTCKLLDIQLLDSRPIWCFTRWG